MNNELTMSHQMYLRDGMKSGTGKLRRFKVSGLPGGGEAFVVNVFSTWRIEGKENWQRFKQHCRALETVFHFTDATELAIDLREYSPTQSDRLARFLNPNVDGAIRGWC
jgi:hypothetical protein